MDSIRSDVPTMCPPGYDPDTGRYHARFDPAADGSPSVDVVEAVSTVVGVSPDELEPLHERVDPEALDALFSDGDCGDTGPRTTVRFTFHGHRIVVGWGEITVTPLPATIFR